MGLRRAWRVLLAAVTVAAVLPVVAATATASPAAAQGAVTLTASGVSATGATLTIANHNDKWHYRRSPATLGPCSSEVAANTSAVTLTGLTPATSYTFKAYSDADCSTELASATPFTTPGLVLSAHDVAVTEGASATYTVKLATAPGQDVTVAVTAATDASGRFGGLTVSPSTLTFTSTSWSTAQTVTVRVAQNTVDSTAADAMAGLEHTATSTDTNYSGAFAAAALTVVDTGAPTLSASNVSATGATLTISNHTDAWYYRPRHWRLGPCTLVAAGTAEVTLTGLTPGVSHNYKAFTESTCQVELTSWERDADFSTPGISLSATRLVAPEGGTASYTVWLATAPAANVTVTVAKATGDDADLTFDTDSGTPGNQSKLTFTTTGWSTPQTVTVTAADESDATDKAYGSATLSHTATGYTTAELSVTEGDDEVCSGTAAVGSATSGDLVDDCDTLLAAKAMLEGANTTALSNWATTLAMNSWTGITVANSRVTRIDLRSKSLSGSIPNTLGGLDGLRRVELTSNPLTGQIPAGLGSLTDLTYLGLADIPLSGEIPAELGNLASLGQLWLRGSGLSGPLPVELGNLTKLTYLHLAENALSGPVPTQLANIAGIQQIFLQQNALSGPIPAQLGNLTKLSALHLHKNALSGQIPATLGRIATLGYLELRNNALSGPIPAELGDLAKLRLFYLGHNALSGPIPTEFGRLTVLGSLGLGNNALTGPIPTELANLAELHALGLHYNDLSGPIPPLLGNLAGLERLTLQGNRLSGPIPAQLGELSELFELYLHRNDLSGPMPAELGDLASLRWLRLNDNALSGPIPAELGKLTRLRHLFLSHNALSGAVPPELGALAPFQHRNYRLQELHLQQNELTGCVPASLLALTPDDAQFTQRDGTVLPVCDGIVLSHTQRSVPEGATRTYTVRLAAAPDDGATVTVTLAGESGGDTSITFDTDSVTPGEQNTPLTFDGTSWDTPQTVTLAAADDADAALGTATITHSASSDDDSGYDGATAALVATEVDDDRSLSATNVTSTRATLKIVAPGSNWYYRHSAPTVGSCSSEHWDDELTASLSNLKPATSYTFKAYSDSTCSTELTTDATDAEFTTASGVQTSVPAVVVPEGSTWSFTVHLATEPTHSVTVTVTGESGGDADVTFDTDSVNAGNQSRLTFTTTNYSTPQTVTVAAAADDADTEHGTNELTLTPSSTDSAYSSGPAKVLAVESDDDAVLRASMVTSTTAVLTLANHSGSWYLGQGGSCTAQDEHHTVRLRGLSPGTKYTFKAYSDAACESELTNDDTDAELTTSGSQTSALIGGGTPGGIGGGGGGGASRAASVRLAGATRYETAAATANRFVALVEDASAAAGSRQQVDTVIVASGEAFPDALAASALARTLRAPVVLTGPHSLNSAVKAFITRHRITKVVVVGGPAAVSDDVEDALTALPGIESVTRHAGPDRYATAALIAQAAGAPGSLCGSTTPTVIVTTGQNFPDALVAGPLAYRGRHPIVLTEADRLPQPTAEYLTASGAKQAIIVGGPVPISKAVVDAIKALGLETSRVSGSDRADTSAQFARRFSTFSGPSCYRRDTVGLATGFAFPDALSAAALLGHYGAPLLLTSPDGVPQPLIDYAASGKLEPDFDQPPIVTIGGRNAVPSNHPTKLLAALPR